MTRLPYTRRQRHRWAQTGLGYRPTSGWSSGDLPAPWAEGDVVQAPDGFADDPRSRGLSGLLTVSYATSIGDGDEWFFRVTDGDTVSDRLHVGFKDRADGWDEDVDRMAGCVLVDTADPDGLARREAMLADGWTPPPRCPHCGAAS